MELSPLCETNGVKSICVPIFPDLQTYFGVDVDSIEDPVRRRAVKTMIKTYGQTPKQLFKGPHPQQGSGTQGSKSAGSKGMEKQKSIEKELAKLVKVN